jgi:hypothetical protein
MVKFVPIKSIVEIIRKSLSRMTATIYTTANNIKCMPGIELTSRITVLKAQKI